ncbi:MAG TPA: DMT family transporter [Myxococcota bacterium]|nr:DMT family transporter [Myxococcota bacterium]
MSEPLTRRQAYGLLALVVLIWGANWPILKVGVSYISPLWFACARFWLGAACLFAYLAATGQLARPTRRDLPVIATVGLSQMALFQPMVNVGLTHVSAGRSAVLVYTTPLWVVPGAMLFLHERVGALKWAGVALGLLGVALLFNPASLDWSDRGLVAGSALLMAAALSWSIAVLQIRAHRWHLSPLQVTPWQLLLAALVVTPVAFLVDGGARPRSSPALWAVLAYNGPLATAFAFWAATSISRSLPAVTSSLSFLAVPAMGIAVSAAALGEVPDATLLGGFALILAGVGLVSFADLRAMG